MKITAIILLSAALQVSAKGISQNVTLSVKDAPLEKVFTEIKKQTGYEFFYYRADLEKGSKVSLEVTNATLDQVLQQVFKEQPLTYTVIDKNIVIKTKPANQIIDALPPPIDVKGRVVNENGEPIIGASVQVKGEKNKGTNTDQNGFFLLRNVDENATLIISSVNIEEFSIKVNGKSDLSTLSVKTRVTTGQGVTISNGYQQLKSNEVTGSVVTITKEQLNMRIAPDIITKLEGLVPGLVFNKDATTGQNKIRIRGESTIYGYTEPLVIVDNFPYPIENINEINPNDVESITILKDAAAASIWGVRAGNGVIVITTKTGKVNQRLRVQVSVNNTIVDRPRLSYLPLISTSEYIDFETYLFKQGQYTSALTSNVNMPAVPPLIEILNDRSLGLISAADSAIRVNALRSNDWKKQALEHIYQNAISQQYQINLSGGSNNVGYNFSVGYDKARENLIGNSGSRLTVSNKTFFRPFKKIEFQLAVNYNENSSVSGGISETSIPNFYPYTNLVDENGNQLAVPQHRIRWEDTIVNHSFLNMKYYPLQERELSSSSSKIYTTRLMTQMQYSILPSLKLSMAYQYYHSASRIRSLIGNESYSIRNRKNTFAIVSNGEYRGTNYPDGGILTLGNSNQIGHSGRIQLDFNQTWGNHTVSAVGGFEVRENKSDGTTSQFYGYDDATGSFQIPNLFASYTTYVGVNPVGSANIGSLGLNSSAEILNRYRSYYTNTSYIYKSRYTLSGSVRFDQANIFGVKTKQKGIPLWSFGGKWAISKENFYRVKQLPDLSLRVTYGYQGNVSPTAVAVTTIMYNGNDNNTGLPISIIDNFPNPQLRWEKSGQLNIGLDFATKNNVLSGSLEYFRKKGTDLFGYAPIDPTTGISTLLGNFSDMKSKGIDLSITTKNIDRKFKWFTTFIFNYASEKVTRYDVPALASGTKSFSYTTATPIVGYSLYSLFSYQWGGLDQATGDPRIYLGDTLTYASGTPPLLNMSDLVFNGRYYPPYSGSISNRISWKAITLSFNITYKLGHYFRRNTINYGAFLGNWRSGHKDFNLRWQKPGDETSTDVPSFIFPNPSSNRDDFYTGSNILVERADHIRFQFIDLNYSLGERLLHKMKIQSAGVHFYVNNLGIIWRANKKGIDPDYPYLNYPPSRSYSIGINVGF